MENIEFSPLTILPDNQIIATRQVKSEELRWFSCVILQNKLLKEFCQHKIVL